MNSKIKENGKYSSSIAEGYKNSKKYKSLISYLRQHSDNTSAQIMLAKCYKYGWGVEVNLSKMVEWYQKAVDKGSVVALNNLGICYQHGSGVDKNLGKAVKLYMDASSKGSIDAKYNLGLCFEYGIGVNKDIDVAMKIYEELASKDYVRSIFRLAHCYEQKNEEDLAIKLYEEAAKKGHARAQYTLACRYEKGRGVEKNLEEAFRLYELSAKQGDIEAIYNLGVCYANGIGVEINDDEAVKLYIEAAKKGKTTAQYILGIRYENGKGVDKDFEKAIEYYSLAANQGHKEAQRRLLLNQLMLGLEYEAKHLDSCIESGFWTFTPELKRAMELYQLAYEGGNAQAAAHLGSIYLSDPVPKDEARAINMLRFASEHGSAMGMEILGECYEYGNGVEPDIKKAVKLYRDAAELDYDLAQYRLGVCYYNANGIEKDDKAAYDLFWKAANSPNDCAGAYIYIGFFFEKGIVVDKSNKKAFEWYMKAFEVFVEEDFDELLEGLRMSYVLESMESLVEDKMLLQQKIDELENRNREIERELSSGPLAVLKAMENQTAIILKSMEANQKAIEKTIDESRDQVESVIEDGFKDISGKVSDIGDTVSIIEEEVKEINKQLKSMRDWFENDFETILRRDVAELNEKLLTATLEDRNEVITEFIEKKISEINKYVSNPNANKLLTQEESYLKGIFGAIWDKMLSDTRDSLRSARVLWRCCSEITDETFDYSGVCISLTAALESELKRVFFFGLQQYLLETYGMPSYSNYNWPIILLVNNGNKINDGRHITLGSISYLLGVGYKQTLPNNDKNKEHYDPLLREKMIEYLRWLIKDSMSTNNPVSLFTGVDSRFTKDCDDIAQHYRNEAAHIGTISKSQVNDCYEKIVGNQKFAERQGKVTSLLIRLYSAIDIDKLMKLPALPERQQKNQNRK